MSASWFARLSHSVSEVDELLDANVSEAYKQQPLAQHWARIAKVNEEAGEAVDALVVWTGQNPRKEQRDEAYNELLDELADAALTAIYASQHFTKDADETLRRLLVRAERHAERLSLAALAAADEESGPDPGSFGGHPYTPRERELGYGTSHDPRFDPRFLPPADEAKP